MSLVQSHNIVREKIIRDDSHIIFCSNDYLNLSQHPEVKNACISSIHHHGVGSGGSSYVCGYTQSHAECENTFSRFLNRDASIFVGNGYMANLATITALSDRNTVILLDRNAHASLIDACRLSFAKTIRYQAENLQTLCEQHANKKKLIVANGICSTNGAINAVDTLIKMAGAFDATLIIDDAHGVGVLGKTGRGVCELFNATQTNVPILICPLGKAFGVYGAIISGQSNLIDTINQKARSLLFSTAPPPALADAARSSLYLLEQEPWRLQKLHHNIQYFKQCADQHNIALLPSISAIQSILIKEEGKAIDIKETLYQQGFFIGLFRPPSVPTGQNLLRFTLNSEHTKKNMVDLFALLKEKT